MEPMEPIKTDRLKAMTFGVTFAPYLATKTIQQLTDFERKRYLVGGKLLGENFYVDNLLGGADSITELKNAQDKVIALLNEVGFEIH